MSYASTALSVAANIKRAKSLLSGGGSGSASPGGGDSGGRNTPATAQPNVSFVTSNENQIATAINGQQQNQPPIKVYTVASDVKTAQELERNLINSNSL